ncbi:MAG: hypothetical protein LBP24_01690, partial [Coriobacteriales bacterium]|nr:hypothetical protein [Coriobacteriales bacterium]
MTPRKTKRIPGGIGLLSKALAVLLAINMAAMLALPFGIFADDIVIDGDGYEAEYEGSTGSQPAGEAAVTAPDPAGEQAAGDAPAQEQAAQDVPAQGAPEQEAPAASGGFQALGGFTPMAVGDAEVSDWAQLRAAISNSTVTRIIFKNNIQRSGGASDNNDLPTVTRTLEIDGGNFSLDFRNGGASAAINRSGFRLGQGVTGQFTLKGLTIIRPNATTYSLIGTSTSGSGTGSTEHNAANSAANNSASAGWTVNIENVTGNSSALTSGIVSLPNGRVNFGGTVNWSISQENYLINARVITFQANSKVNLSAGNRVIHSQNPNTSVTATGGAQVTLYGRDNQVIWIQPTSASVPPASAGSANITVTDRAVLDISGDGYGTGDDGATVTMVAYSGGYTVSGGGKLNIRSLCGVAGRANTSGTRGQPALISQITNGVFNVTGEGSELFLESYGNSNIYGATIRFRYGGGQQFNVSDKGKVTIIKQARGSGYEGTAAIRFGMADGNEFHVNSGGVVHVENFGNNNIYDASTSEGNNAAIEYDANSFVFDVSGYQSAIEVIAHRGPAINASGRNNGSITVGEGAIFVASGRTSAQPPSTSTGPGRYSAIFSAGNNFTFTANKPLYYDFTNNRPGGGRIFNTGSNATFTSTASDVALWGNGTFSRAHNPVSGDPFRSWTNITYNLRGENFSTFGSSDDSTFGTASNSLGPNGMLPYTRISGNNAPPKIRELFEASNADKYVRGHATVPEGINFDGRGVWTDEVWTELEVTPVNGGAPYKVVASSLENEDVYGTVVDGVLRYSKGDFLVPGDTYRVLRAWRGDSNPDVPNAKVHMSQPADLTAAPVTVVDKTPPTPVTVTSHPDGTLWTDNRSISGTYADMSSVAHNSEPITRIYAVVNGTGTEVDATLDAQGPGTWSVTLPSNVTLADGNTLYLVAVDSSGNANPLTATNYHDTSFPAAASLAVKEFPVALSANNVEIGLNAAQAIKDAASPNAALKTLIDARAAVKPGKTYTGGLAVSVASDGGFTAEDFGLDAWLAKHAKTPQTFTVTYQLDSAPSYTRTATVTVYPYLEWNGGIGANSFSISANNAAKLLNKVTAERDAELIARAGAEAYEGVNPYTGTLSPDNVAVEGHTIKAVAGTWTVTFRMKNVPSRTITVNVIVTAGNTPVLSVTSPIEVWIG